MATFEDFMKLDIRVGEVIEDTVCYGRVNFHDLDIYFNGYDYSYAIGVTKYIR